VCGRRSDPQRTAHPSAAVDVGVNLPLARVLAPRAREPDFGFRSKQADHRLRIEERPATAPPGSMTVVSLANAATRSGRSRTARDHVTRRRGAKGRAWVRFAASWLGAAVLLAVGVPRAVHVSWNVVIPVLQSLHWSDALALVAVWFLGLYVHTFLITATAPGLSRGRALTLNVTGSAVANVTPLGGAAGLELNRRMMRCWGLDGCTFTGYLVLINLWGIGCKLLLPGIAVLALSQTGETVAAPLRVTALAAALAFVAFAVVVVTLLVTRQGAVVLTRFVNRLLGACRRVTGRAYELDLAGLALDIRRDCRRLIADGWLRMSTGMVGYVALQCLLLGVCTHVTGAGNTAPEVLAGFAAERLLTIAPITPGGVGVADLGLVSILMAFGGNPAGVTAAAVLYRSFVFAVQIPVGGCALGVWLFGRHRIARREATQGRPASAVSCARRSLPHGTRIGATSVTPRLIPGDRAVTAGSPRCCRSSPRDRRTWSCGRGLPGRGTSFGT
jgi:uncharacterized membrane protein YbhN (UPF0104 family)